MPRRDQESDILMKHKKILFYFLMVSLFFFDVLLKYYLHFEGSISFGDVSFVLRETINEGVLIPYYGEVTLPFQLLLLFSCYGFIFFSFLLFHFFVTRRAIYFRRSVTLIFVASVCSFLDRIIYKGSLNYFHYKDFIFNLSDLYLILGVMTSLIFFFIEGNILWASFSDKNKTLLGARYKHHYSLKMTFITLIGLFCLGFLFHFFLGLAFSNDSENIVRSYMGTFFWAYTFSSLLLSLFVFSMGIYLTQRSAGAIFNFERTILDVLEVNKDLMVKEKKEIHKNLEILAHKTALKIQEKYYLDKKN